MGDKRRFDLFADLVEKHLNKDMNIVDVASGKGKLQAALRRRGFQNVISLDKCRKTRQNRRGYKYTYFNWECKEKYDAVVAMHPDEATDHAVLYAIKHRVPALICPCCVKNDAAPYRDRPMFKNWVAHLERLAVKGMMNVCKVMLAMKGKNLVLILTPGKRK